MAISYWQFVLLAAATAVNVLVAYRIYRLGSRTEAVESVTAVDDSVATAENGRVSCPNCGVENENGYQYCRSCLSELPGAVDHNRDDAGPLGGFTR